MRFETERLILRPWEESDAESCYEYAKDPLVGPMCGWQPHSDIENSRWVVQNVLMVPETYAVCLKEDNRAVGSISLFRSGVSHTDISNDEMEIGYWLGVPFWGKGLIPEAVRCLQKYAYEDLGMNALWIGYYEQNTKSGRVAEKCGFSFHHMEENVPVPMLDTIRNEVFTRQTKMEWENSR